MMSANRLLVLGVVGNDPAGVEKLEPQLTNGPLVTGLQKAPSALQNTLKVLATTLCML
jgi:hypothetical protein